MAEEPDKLGEIGQYLPEGEEIIGRHKVGSYEIVTTTERVNCVRKFPPTFIEIDYSDISSLQHITTIKWNELSKAILQTGFALAIYLNDVGKPFIKPLRDIINTIHTSLGDVLPVEFLMSATIIFSALAGIYSLAQFIPSMRGYFRISRKSGAPLIISTSMGFDLKLLIREIESEMRRKKMISGGLIKEKEPEKEDPIKMKLEVQTILAQKIEDLNNTRVIMLSAKSEKHTPVMANMLDLLINKNNMGGVYLSITKPSDSIMTAIKEANVSTDDIFFIDCISRMAGKIAEKNEQVVYVENPSSLEEISMYLDRMLSRVKAPKKFLMLDSLSSLLIYNTDKSVKEFTHYMINKIRLDQIMGVILTIEKKEAEDLVRTLSPMCDVNIRF